MPPITEQILLAVVQALTSGNGLNAAIFRSREEAFRRDELPAIVIRAGEEDTSIFSGQVDQNAFHIELHIFVRGEVWDSVASAVDMAAHRAVMTSPDIKALCSSFRRTGSRPDGANADITAGELVVRYRAIYLSDSIDRSLLV